MPTQQLPILSPSKGVVRAVGREQQAPDTSWDAQNVVPYDRYGRKRIAQRGGLVKQIVSVDATPTGFLNASGSEVQGMVEAPVLSYESEPAAIGTLTQLNSGSPLTFTQSASGGTAGVLVTGPYTHTYPTASTADTFNWQFTLNFSVTNNYVAGIGNSSSVGTGNPPDAPLPGGAFGDGKFIFYLTQDSATVANTLIVVLTSSWLYNTNTIPNGETSTVGVDFWRGDPGASPSGWVRLNSATTRPVVTQQQPGFSGTIYNFSLNCNLSLILSSGRIDFSMLGASPATWTGTVPITTPQWPNLTLLEVDNPGMTVFWDTGGGTFTSVWSIVDRGTALSALSSGTSAATAASLLVAACYGLVYVGDTAGNFVTVGGQGSGFPGSPLLLMHHLVSMAFVTQSSAIGSIGPAVYMVDGTNFAYYKLSDMAMHAMTQDAGTLPTNCSLCCGWRGRLVLAGDSANPQNFYMSRSGDPQDYDYSQLDPAAAVAGNLSTAGQIGEPIMSLIPFSDDYMMIGCLNSLWMLQGDPADGGTIVCVSNTMGMTAPNAWCVDPAGTLYFIARGGLYTVRPAWEFYRPPELISGTTYDQYFNTIINGNFYLSMVWDVDAKYLHIFATAINEEETGTHMIFDSRNGGLWPQVYPHNYSPVCSTKYLANSINGMPSVLMGGFDSSIRVWTPTALNDDAVAIASYAVLGPVKASPEASILSGITIDMGEVLAADTAAQWNASVKLASGPDAYSVTEGTPHSLANIAIPLDRRQKTFRQRFRGGWHTCTISNSTINTYWSFESALLEFIAAGRNREIR